MSIAWVFPGQGSQKLGMADGVLQLQGALERFDRASESLGRDLLAVCRGDSKEINGLDDINDTRNTQPAMFLVESLLIDDLRRQGREPSLVAGHSLGEISALYAAQVFDFEIGLSLLKFRSELMASAGGGAMSAVIGFDRELLNELIASTKDIVIANDNSDSQVVLSGAPSSVETVSQNLGCKKVIPLNVSGAFHSPYMDSASNLFEEQLEKVPFKEASIPVLSNCDPSPTCDGFILKQRLTKQMNNGVRWRETMEVMIEKGVNNLVEIGPGNVLSGLAKRSMKGIIISQISNSMDLGH